MSDEFEYGDIDPDDAYDPLDEEVDWSQLETLVDQVTAIQSIEDPDERLAAAREWAAQLIAGE